MPGGVGRRLAALATLLLLASCTRLIPETRFPPQPAAKPPTALTAGISRGPAITRLRLAPDDAAGALASFRESCPRLLVRTDGSGLTRREDWQPICAAAASWPTAQATGFFEQWFESVQVGDGKAHATGYYEPEIAGVRTRRPGFDVPVYGLPQDLVRAWPAETPAGKRTGRPPLGRYDASGRFIPYFTRGEIEDGALAGGGLEIAWAADPIELFFLEVQGSGRLVGSDGSVMRIGYAGQNGGDYVALGALMRQRGLIGTGPGQYPGSMQGIMAYLREHPTEGRAMMRENESYVFFREIVGDGPLGALEVPVRARSSVAADPLFVPLGAPVWLLVDRPEANGLWIAQDTGGAIKGANRIDTFWGSGPQARTVAGGMSARGEALLFLPRGTLARHGVQ